VANSIGFAFFILVNAALFIRPAEIIPEWEDVPVYQIFIMAALAFSLPCVLTQLSMKSLAARPITVCVLGLLVALELSHLVHGRTWHMRMVGFEFAKIVAYYLLLVGLLDTPARLGRFMAWTVFFAFVMVSLAVLNYHQIVSIASLGEGNQDVSEQLAPGVWTATRLVTTGIFSDPNDLCLILLVSAAVCCYELGSHRSRVLRFCWLVPISAFCYAIALTYSRGGLIAMLVGLLVLFRGWFGWRKAILLSVVAVPLVLLLYGGRQTEISGDTGTAQERFHYWSEDMVIFRQEPLFGIGTTILEDQTKRVAHNTYLQCYVEMGFVGGTLMVGAFYSAIGGLVRATGGKPRIHEPELRRLLPYLTAAVAGYATGIMFLSRDQVLPTYMMLGLAAVYLRLVSPHPALVRYRMSPRFVGRMIAVSVIFCVFMYVWVRVSIRY
jgi:O-antigen ligase